MGVLMKYYPIANTDKSIFLFDAPFISGFTTRIGGVSSGNFESLNLYYGRGDKKESVIDNFAIFRKKLKYSGQIVFPQQIHDDKIHELITALKNTTIIPKCDAIITRERKIMCGVKFADCVPVLVYGKDYAGIIHSGWRGTLKKITLRTIERLVEKGEDPNFLNLIIGPHISEDNYEIGKDVKKAFIEKGFSGQNFKEKGNKFLLNLSKAIIEPVKKRYSNINIQDIGLDTFSHKELFYSYRRDGAKCGEMIMFFIL